MAIAVREPTVDDADAIALVHVTAWQAAYRGVMPDDFLDGLDVTTRAGQWREGLVAPTEVRRWVATLDGDVVGFAVAGPVRDADLGPDVGELWAINVAPTAWRGGAGTALIDAAVGELRSRGHDSAILWVVRENDRARRFYESAGWSPDGAEKTGEFGGAEVVEVRYRRPLRS